MSAHPPGHDTKWHKLTGISTLLLFFATIVAVGFAWYQTIEAAHARTAQDYLDLRNTFLKVDADLDTVDRNLIYTEKGNCPQWHALKRYWYVSETEWRVADIDSAQSENWQKSQLPHIAHSLKQPSFRGAFIEMWESGRWHDEEGQRFVKAITDQINPQKANADIDSTIKLLKDQPDSKLAPPCKTTATAADAIHWYRDSAEMKAIYAQTYLAASTVAKDAAKHFAPGTWHLGSHPRHRRDAARQLAVSKGPTSKIGRLL